MGKKSKKPRTTVSISFGDKFEIHDYSGAVILGLTEDGIENSIMGAFSDYDLVRLLDFLYDCKFESVIFNNIKNKEVAAAFLTSKEKEMDEEGF